MEKKRILFTLLSSLFLYLCISFVRWDLTWVRFIPYLQVGDRALSLIMILLYQSLTQVIYNLIKK